MKKKFLLMLLAIVSILCLCFGLVACGPKEEVNGHIHNWVWKNNASEHWQVCETDDVEKSESRSAHFDNDEDGKCDICKYSIIDDGDKDDPVVPVEYTVTYNANGGSFADGEETKSVKVEENDKLEIPEEPTRNDFVFVHWCTDSSLSVEWVFENDTVTHDTMLYAQWETVIIEHDVTFILNYEGAKEVVKPTENDLITYIPERENYVFNGWWLSDGQTESGDYILAQKWDSTEKVIEDGLILVAEWVEKSTVSSQLSAPSVSITANVFSWSEVLGAVSYDIRVYKSGSSKEELKQTVYDTNWTFPSGYEAGYYNVKIRAMGDGMTTVNSAYVSKSYGHLILSTISKIDFDITTSILTWTAVKNATSYVLYVDNQEVETLTYLTYDFSDYEAGEYSIKIVAKRDGYQSSTTKLNITKKRLKTPIVKVYATENATYVLMWDSVINANTYIISNGDKQVKVHQNNYSLDGQSTLWSKEGTVALTIAAYDSEADYLISNSSEELNLVKLYLLSTEVSTTEAGTTSISGEMFTKEKLISQSFEVTFNYNYTDSKNSTQTVTSSLGLEYPSVPTRSGYLFRGWYKESGCRNLYDFTSNVTEDITLYAGWYSVNGSNATVIDATNYNSSSRVYSLSTSGTSSSNYKYTYFSVLTDGEYKLYYANSSSVSNYATYVYIYNVTQSKVIKSNASISSTSYSNIAFNAKAGDVIYIRNYRYNTNYYASFKFYVSGAKKPAAGGKCDYLRYFEEEISNQNNQGVVAIGKEVTITAKTEDDRYIFEGWYLGDEVVSTELSYDIIMPSKNITYVARWKYYTVTTKRNNPNAGTITEYNEKVVKVGEEITLKATTNNGYTWVGWYDNDEELTKDATFSFTMNEQNVIYEARWSKTTIKVNNSEAGTVTKLDKAYKVGEQVTVTAKTNDGYTWVGWYVGEKKVSTNLSYEIILGADDIILEARWTFFTLSTSVNNVNAGFLNQSYDQQKITAGEQVTLLATTNKGYTWIGWFEDNTKVSKDCSYNFTMGEKSISLQARWCKISVTSNKPDAGTINELTDTYEAGEEVVLSAITNQGYTWVGWYKDNEKISPNLSCNIIMGEVDAQYEARWIKVEIRLSDENAGTVMGLDSTYKVGDHVTVSAVTNSGYSWVGWYKNKEIQTTSVEFSFDMPSEDIEYTAVWSAERFNVKLNPQGGEIHGQNTIEVEMGGTVELEVPVKSEYVFGGWYYGTQPITDSLGKMLSAWNIADDAELTAKWLRTITFQTNGGSSVTAKNVEPGEIVASLPISTKKGYTLLGWLYNSITYSSNFVMPDANITMSAQWTASQYQIIIDGTTRVTVTYGKYYSLTKPSKSGYTFRYYTISGTTTQFPMQGTYDRAENTYLTSCWANNSLSKTVSGSTTISESTRNLEKGMTFTITFSNNSKPAKSFHIDSNLSVNVVFSQGSGSIGTYNNTRSCGIKSTSGTSYMVITITILDVTSASSLNLSLTCGY